MATPDFILKLRARIGHEALWIPGARAVVFDDAGRVLLGQRADNGQWGLITGILEPGEEPAAGMLREVLEETGVVAAAERLVSVDAVGPTTYPNGDVCHFLTLDSGAAMSPGRRGSTTTNPSQWAGSARRSSRS